MNSVRQEMSAYKHADRGTEIPITLDSEGGRLWGTLVKPPLAKSVIVFVHGSGSSRFSPRNQSVAAELNAAGLATFLFDLFTPEEEEFDAQTRSLRFDIDFLAARTIHATKLLCQNPQIAGMKIGYFGASTGAAAALIASVALPNEVSCVVSRGGRPDLASEFLSNVTAPTLLIVGGDDLTVLDLNKKALARLRCEKLLAVIPGATHLFEEPGALKEVARLANRWFVTHLR
jgi:putative phosphoribosyl transferase